MFLGPGINAAMQKANKPEMKHSQLSYGNSRALINNVEVKNIKSASCASLIYLRKKLLQHVDHIVISQYNCYRQNPLIKNIIKTAESRSISITYSCWRPTVIIRLLCCKQY